MALAANLPRVTSSRSLQSGRVVRDGLAALPLAFAILLAVIYAAFVSHGLSDAIRGRICHTIVGIQHLPADTQADRAADDVGSWKLTPVDLPAAPEAASATAADNHHLSHFVETGSRSPIAQLVAHWIHLLLWVMQLACTAIVGHWTIASVRSAVRQRCHRSVVLHC